jgi:hypothetical protein
LRILLGLSGNEFSFCWLVARLGAPSSFRRDVGIGICLESSGDGGTWLPTSMVSISISISSSSSKYISSSRPPLSHLEYERYLGDRGVVASSPPAGLLSSELLIISARDLVIVCLGLGVSAISA